jgi:hypothetical protein
MAQTILFVAEAALLVKGIFWALYGPEAQVQAVRAFLLGGGK